MNLLQEFNQRQTEKLVQARAVPEFAPGDTLRLSVRIVEGERERTQAFEGVCIARKSRAKLYYLRGRSGKAARIREKQDMREDGTPSES